MKGKVFKYNRIVMEVVVYQPTETNPEYSIEDIKAKIKEFGGSVEIKSTKLVADIDKKGGE